jgi:predicted RNA-binding protein with PIN domain
MDALDECGADDLRSLTGAIEKLYAPGAPDANLKFLFTSRPYERIDRQFRPIHRSGPCIRLAGEDEEEAEQITAEIGLVIRDRVQAISIEMDLEPDEEQFLGAELMSVENRTYLWVMLTLDVIRNSPTFTKGTVRQALQNLPTSVETAYERILAHTTDAEKAKKLLQIILAAVRPLTLQEIAVALDLTSTHKTIADLQAEMEPLARFRKTIRDLCGLVVTVVDSKVYLLHQTVKEFLIDPAARAPLSGWKYCLGLGPSHGILAAASMQLLLLDDFRTRPLDPFCKPEELEALFSELDAVDLLTYAATNWAEHLDTSCRFPASDDGEQRRQLLELGTRVCAMDLGGTPWPQVLHVLNQRDPATAHDEEGPSPAECWDWWPTDAEDYYRGMPALHVASHLGLKWLVQHLLTVHGADAKGPPDGDPLARTALHWACRSDNGACVSNLLRVSDDSTHINTMDRHECTPLHDACRGDLGRTTTFLLHLDADPETRGATHGITALHVAAAAGSTDALGALLDARDGINLNPRDRQGRTPLMYAAAGWQLAVVDMLVKAGADVEGRDEDGRTALLHVGGRRLRPPPRRKAFAWSAAQPLAHSVGEVFAEIGRTLRAARKEREKEEANRDPRVLERVEQLKVAIKLQCMRTCSFAEVMAILYDGKPTGNARYIWCFILIHANPDCGRHSGSPSLERRKS